MQKPRFSAGLVSVSFRELTPKEILQAMKKANLLYVEWGSDVHAPCNDILKLKEIANLQAEYGVTCCSYGTYFRLGQTPIEELERYITASKILGTDTLRLWCGTKSGYDMTDAEKKDLLNVCKQADQIAKKHGVTLCMECHKNTFTENPDDNAWLMCEINSNNFKTYWQPFQWQNAEQNLENARKLAPFSKNVHVFNWKGDKKFPLQTAVSEWQEYLSLFDNPSYLLLEFMPNGKIEELETEANSLRTIIGE